MRRLSRRRLLALGGAGLAGLSGCSTGSESETPRPGGGGGNSGGDTATPTPSPTTRPGPDFRYPAFAERTARIADGIVWHATRWDPTMGEVRSRANQVVSAVLSMQQADTITEGDIDALEGRTTEMATYLRESVVPHYDVPDEAVLTGNNVLVQQLRIASQRGDTENQRSQLRGLKSLYEKYTQSYFLENAFPNGPIQAKLFGDLTLDEGTSAVFGVFHPPSRFAEAVTSATSSPTTSDDGVPQHTHEFPSGHVVVAHTHPHGGTHDLNQHENEPVTRQLYAYRNGQFDILQDTNPELPNLSAFEPHLIDVFRSVSVPDRREDVVYVSVNNPVADFLALPLQIQQFDSAATAAEAVDFLLTSDISQEGTTTVAGREWRRVFYTQQGTNIYAFLLQTGSCVITLFPEPVVWEERVDWPGPFGKTWIVGGNEEG